MTLEKEHNDEANLPTYHNQNSWRDLMAKLPGKLHISENELPMEECWKWKGHLVHLDRYENAESPCKIILHHGVGTNGRQMTLLIGNRLKKQGYSVVSPDNLGYGVTKVSQSSPPVTYADWVDLLSDLIDDEISRDGKPVFLFGLSAGGMISFNAAGKNQNVKGVIGLTFLDERIYQVRKETSIHPIIAPLIPLLICLVKYVPFLNRFKIPMKLVSKMYALHNDKNTLSIFLKDKSSSGAWVSLAFLKSFMTYVPCVEPKDFNVCPVLLAQPELDRWTPEHLSTLSLAGLKPELFTIKTLQNAGHYPSEDPGVEQLLTHFIAFMKENIDK